MHWLCTHEMDTEENTAAGANPAWREGRAVLCGAEAALAEARALGRAADERVTDVDELKGTKTSIVSLNPNRRVSSLGRSNQYQAGNVNWACCRK